MEPVSEARYQEALRRLLDVSCALVLIALALPLFIAAALATTLADGGPILFWQRRVGLGGREFWMPKIRSMRLGAEASHGALQTRHGASQVTFKLQNDPRVTAIGRILRILSIDELPQLWCVCRGEMSMVGPRPPLPHEVAQYTERELGRLRVKPGLTCFWQIRGRSDLPFKRQVALDLAYVRRRSVRLDVAILWLTIPAVLSRRGAY